MCYKTDSPGLIWTNELVHKWGERYGAVFRIGKTQNYLLAFLDS